MMLNFKKIFFNLSLLSIVSIIALILPENVFAGYDCPGSSSPPANGIYDRYCTDGDNNGTDAGRLLKITIAPGQRLYPNDVLKFHAKIFDYNESCGVNSCLKDILSTTDIVRQLTGSGLYNVGNGSTVTFKLFDPSGTEYNQGSSGAGGTWANVSTTSQSSTTQSSEPTFTFTGTNYGTWWLYAQDNTTHDYTWMPLSYSADLDTTPTSFYGYTVPKWMSDFYNNNVAFMQSMEIQDGPSKGLFHDSRIEPRITDLGSTAGPVKMYMAYEDTMQSGMAIKTFYDLWKETGDSRLTDMMNTVLNNVYLKYQGDFNSGNTDPKLSTGTSGNWVQGNYNDNLAAYAYTKSYSNPPYADSEVWLPEKGTWATTGWSDLGSGNDTSGDQDAGQLVGIYYIWKYLTETDPSNSAINTLVNIVKAGNSLTGGTSSGWTQWTNNTAGGRSAPLLYIILNKMVGLTDFFSGSNNTLDKYLSNSTSQGYGSTNLQKITTNPTSATVVFDDDAHHIFYTALAAEINDQTDQTISGSYNITDLKNDIEQQIQNENSFAYQPDSTYFSKQDVTYQQLFYNSSANKTYLNTSTTDGTVNQAYTGLVPWGEMWWPHEIANSAGGTDYNYNALYGIVKRSSYDQDYNFLPMTGLSTEGLYIGTFFMEPYMFTEYRIRYTIGALEQIAYYLADHKTNTEKNDIDSSNTSLSLLGKTWDESGNLNFKTWSSGTVTLSTQNTRSGYIYNVAQSGSTGNQTVTVDTSGKPTFAALTNDTYTVSQTDNLSVIPASATVDVNVSNWDNTNKTWTESSSTHNNNTTNNIQGLHSFTTYQVTVDGAPYTTVTTNSSGNLTFNYTGTFSTHTFNVTQVGTVQDTSLSPGNAPVCQNTTPNAPVITSAKEEGLSSILLSFTGDTKNTDHYTLEYGTQSGKYIYGLTNIGNQNTTDYLVNFIKPNTPYYFRILAVNGCAPSLWSNEFYAINLLATSSPTPQSLNITSSTLAPEPKPSSSPSQITQNGYIVKVKVIDSKSNPVEGATVTVHSQVQEAVTDKNGIAQFNNLEEGEHKILISYSGYQGEKDINLAGNNKNYDLTITADVKNSELVQPLEIFIIILISLVLILIIVIFIILRKRRTSQIHL